MWRTGETILTG